MNDPRTEFILESRDHLTVFEQALLSLERALSGEEARQFIRQGLRAIHSFKGDSGFLGYSRLRQLAHAMESLLEEYRDGARLPAAEVIEALLKARDRLAVMLEEPDSEQVDSAACEAVLQQVQRCTVPLRQVPVTMELAGWRILSGGDLVDRFQAIAALGQLQDPELTGFGSATSFGRPDSDQWSRETHLRLRGLLATRATDSDLQQVLVEVLPGAAPALQPGSALRTVTIDLTEWQAVSGLPLISLLAAIDRTCRVERPRVVSAGPGLRDGLPHPPIVWQASIGADQDLPELADAARSCRLGSPADPDAEISYAARVPTSTVPAAGVVPATGTATGTGTAAAVGTASVAGTASVVGTATAVGTPSVIAATAAAGLVAEPTIDAGDSVSSANFPAAAMSAAAMSAALTSRTRSAPDEENLRSLRVRVSLLDQLMNLVGELTLIRNQTLVRAGDVAGDSRNLIQRLNSVTSELQEAVLQTRMQPVGNLFGRFPRMVRDLARQLGREVEVTTAGQEVELDKTVLERLSDPLTHLIRNSIDHGIEPPDVRQAAGKPRTGRIMLSAVPADGQVCLEIRDDGRGIDPTAVRARAAALGLRTPAELERMSQRDLFALILLPGFSTAKAVTDISGRGVGMDVVRTNVEELEGSLTIDSTPGAGTSVILRVPLTLAIVPCLIVTEGSERFAVPQREVEEVVCLHPNLARRIEQAYDSQVLRLRDSLLPVIRLSEVLRRPRPFSASDKAEILASQASAEHDPCRIEYILILRCRGKRLGLLVDCVVGREEIVVKPLHPGLKQLSVFSGATLMGDGRVALIVNVEGIVAHARCDSVPDDDRLRTAVRDPREVHRVLLFEYGPDEQFALPLVQVRRVELLNMDRVERIGDRDLVTIDGRAIRILRPNQVMNVSACDESPTMFLILPKFVPDPMGILVSRIIDTDSLAIDLQENSGEPAVLGTATVRGRLTLFLDVQQLRERLFDRPRARSSSGERHGEGEASVVGKQRILLIDDTAFFREIVRRYLTDDTTEVVTACDGLEGLELISRQQFDLVVTDIEMPRMDGWTFCTAARERGLQIPILALTSLGKSEHEQRALACGFDDFEEKLDHDRLKRKVFSLLRRSVPRRAQR